MADSCVEFERIALEREKELQKPSSFWRSCHRERGDLSAFPSRHVVYSQGSTVYTKESAPHESHQDLVLV